MPKKRARTHGVRHFRVAQARTVAAFVRTRLISRGASRDQPRCQCVLSVVGHRCGDALISADERSDVGARVRPEPRWAGSGENMGGTNAYHKHVPLSPMQLLWVQPSEKPINVLGAADSGKPSELVRTRTARRGEISRLRLSSSSIKEMKYSTCSRRGVMACPATEKCHGAV